MEDSIQEPLDQTLPVDWQHNKDLGDCMIELFKNRLWTDVKFRCKDHDENERIHAHKIVLAARSPVFQAMFFGPCADGKDEVVLTNAEADTFRLFLRYIYSDTVTLTTENASAVLEMAHYYQVSNLVQFCSDYLALMLTPENACDILTLALFYKVSTLRDVCCNFIDRKAEKCLSSEGFLEIPEDCLTYILKGDTFYADEYNIFIKAEEWSRRNIGEGYHAKTGQNIRKTLGASFYHLRLPTMTSETLMKCTRKKGYFSAEEYEDIFDFVYKHTPIASSVTSNSCVARLPKEETMIINHLDGDTSICDRIRTMFQITVTRPVKLTQLVVTRIQQHLKYKMTHFKRDEGCASVTFDDRTSMYTFFTQNDTKVLELERNSNYTYSKINTVKELKAAHGEDLSELGVGIFGTLQITRTKPKQIHIYGCRKLSKQMIEDAAENKGTQDEISEEKKEEDDENGGEQDEIFEEEDEEDENEGNQDETSEEEEEEDDLSPFYPENEVIFRQNFQLQSDKANRRIDLSNPLTLTEDASPYTFGITMHYRWTSGVKMKTICSKTKTARSKFGQLQVQDIAGQFAGIESIGFENISNR